MELNEKNLYAGFQKYSSIINPFGAMVQCYHETFDKGLPFNSELCSNANNLAGIKKGSGWFGPVYMKNSWEQKSSGEKYNQVSPFRKYSSWQDFVKDYAHKIKNDYPLSSKSSDNFFGYYSGLSKGKWGAWATDLNYFKALVKYTIKLAPEFFGEEWKDKLRTSYQYALKNNRFVLEQHCKIVSDVLN